MWHKLSFALLFAVLTCGQIASAQKDECNDMIIQKDFKWPEFSGVWYEHSRYPDLKEFGEKCIYRNYTFKAKDTFVMKVSGLSKSNQPVSIDAAGTIMAPGFLYVNFPSGAQQVDRILGTDYKSWAAIYSCQSNGKNIVEKTWILTRERNADAQTVTKAALSLTENYASTQNLRDIIQGGCVN